MNYKFASVIIGAGPAGLLYALICRILLKQQNEETASWPILLVDKRESYTRTHQLTLDSGVFSSLRNELADQDFDSLVSYLGTWSFRIPVNKLENFLFDLLEKKDVNFINLELLKDNLETALLQLPYFNAQNKNTWISIIGADSVRSTLRNHYFENSDVITGAHQYLARLIVHSQFLPKSMNILDNIKLSKFISSLIAYRYNPNGYAEVDLFLNEKEFNEVIKLGANPKEVFKFNNKESLKINAPLFNDFIALALEYTKGDPSAGISLQSTFKLEHSVSKYRFKLQSANKHVFFLLGDAAIALPFQRGMSALAQTAYELALTNINIYKAIKENKETEIPAHANYYQIKTDKIIQKELKIVKARSRLIATLTYFSRISAMVPFPMQSWLLSIRFQKSGTSWKHFGSIDFVNLVLVLCSSTALAIPMLTWPAYDDNILKSVFVSVAFLIQFMGGFFYRITLSFDQSHYWSKAFWRTQILIWLILGIAGSLRESVLSDHLNSWLYVTFWWLGGVVFALGLMLADRIIKSAYKD